MELITKDLIKLDLSGTTKVEIINELADILVATNRLNNQTEFLNSVFSREKEISTGIGKKIAIPHARTNAVKIPSLVFARSVNEVDYDAIDNQPTDLYFMIAVPESAGDEHLQILQKLSRKLMDDDFVNALRKSEDEAEILKLINGCFTEEINEIKVDEDPKLKIVAIANCPAGIAHTYMVAESLEQKGTALGYQIKVETQGASGVENKLTKNDIEAADYVILALGKGLDETTKKRFSGKKIYNIKISEALKNVDDIFLKLQTESKVMGEVDSNDYEDELELSGIFQHLMNGVSFVIPFVVAGGLLLSLSTILSAYIPVVDGSISLMFETVGVYGLKFMTPILGGYIAYSIADKPGLAPGFIISYMANDTSLLGTKAGSGFLGAIIIGLSVGYFVKWMKTIKLNKTLQPLMSFLIIPFTTVLIFSIITFYFLGPILGEVMHQLNALLISSSSSSAIVTSIIVGMMICFDAGGPVNKTAFLFALGLVDQGIYSYYGVVAVGVIVPSMAAGIAAQIRPSLFSKNEVEAGKASIISGSFGIGEPSIPFIVADPKPLIAANLITGAYIGIVAFFLGIERIAPGPGLIEPLLGITSPALGFYFAVISGIMLNALLIVIFKKSFGKGKQNV